MQMINGANKYGEVGRNLINGHNWGMLPQGNDMSACYYFHSIHGRFNLVGFYK